MNASQLYIPFEWVILAWLITIGIGLGIVILYKHQPISLFNSMFLIPLIASVLVSSSLLALKFQLILVAIILKDLGLIIISCLIFIGIILTILLIIQTIFIWRQQTKALRYILLLLIGLIAVMTVVTSVFSNILSVKLKTLFTDVELSLFLYFISWLVCFMTAFIVYRVVKPSLDKDYILILGAGLSDGIFVSPILQHRVQKGLDFAQTQFNQTGKYPYVIMSGGQGTDETLPEAVAMANYARKVGFPPEYILLETASRNTFENMQFSKQILQAHGLDIKKGIFVTSGYHVFRASVYAHDNGLKINGIGSKTRHHFWYDALIREYLAILARYYRLHLLVLLILVLLSLVSMFVKL